MMTSAPHSARARADAAPMPRPAAVTIATRSSMRKRSSNMAGTLPGRRRERLGEHHRGADLVVAGLPVPALASVLPAPVFLDRFDEDAVASVGHRALDEGDGLRQRPGVALVTLFGEHEGERGHQFALRPPHLVA